MDLPILVMGGGPAGSICARELARRGRDVLLTHRTGTPKRRPAEMCNPASLRLLEADCGLSVPTRPHRAVGGLSAAWGSDVLDGRSFSFWQVGDALLLDRGAFDEWLLAAAEAAGVTVLRSCEIRGGRWDDDRWALRAIVGDVERSLTVWFVVEATGRSARSVLHPDVKRLMADELFCVSAERPESEASGADPVVEACRDGWWYTARQVSGRRVVALFTDATLVPSAHRRLDWLNRLLATTKHVRPLAYPLPPDALVDVCDARTSIRNVLWRRTWLSIGDAAWSLDPLSGAGIQRAIQDGLDAAAAIARVAPGADLAPLRSHAASRARAFVEALETQRRYYTRESRWRDSPFWSRRQARETWRHPRQPLLAPGPTSTHTPGEPRKGGPTSNAAGEMSEHSPA